MMVLVVLTYDTNNLVWDQNMYVTVEPLFIN